MEPWLSPIRDNLEYLLRDRKMLDLYFEDGTIEVEAMTYIRGRSISNAYIVIDESQQLTQHETNELRFGNLEPLALHTLLRDQLHAHCCQSRYRCRPNRDHQHAP